MNVDNRHRISEFALKRLFEGKELRAGALRFRVTGIDRDHVSFDVEIVDEMQNVISTICSADEMKPGCSLSVMELDRVFNITVSS